MKTTTFVLCFVFDLILRNAAPPCEGTPLNTPPYISVEREWLLTEDEPLGSVVTRVQVQDDDGNPVSVSIGSPSSSATPGRNGRPLIDAASFFKIDDENRVILVKSLHGMAGETFLVGIVASDGITPKNRIDAKVSIRRTKKTLPKINIPQGLPSSFDPGPPPPLSDINRHDWDVGPPLLHLDPFTVWDLRSDAPVGSLVTTVEAEDLSGSFLRFSLSPPDGIVSINPETGQVVVRTSLIGKEGNHSIKIEVSNKFRPISESVTIRVRPPSGDRFITDNDDDGHYSISAPAVPRGRDPFNPAPDIYNISSAITTTTTTAATTITATTPYKDVVPVVEKETKTSLNEPKTGPTLGWNAGLLALVLGLVLTTSCAVLFLAWRCRRKIKLHGEAKENVVLYNEKRRSISHLRRASSSSSPSGNRDSIFEGIFSFVGVRKRAESNGYEEDVVPPRVPNRESKSSRKSSNTGGEEDQKDTWEFPRHKLRVLGILGEGCFGQVWKCEVTDLVGDESAFVAVKTLKESAGASEAKDLLQELKVLKSLGRHPNVVSLLGCCTEKEPMFIILEYMSGGKLQSFLRTSRAGHSYGNLHGISSSLTPRDLTIFALQVARGMDFLSKNGIVHRDLAARNILIGKNKICKVADFGFARDVANNHVYERKSDGRLPIRWMAPESLFDNIFTTKSDVWSFGILLWEIVTLGSTPYPGMSAAEVMKSVKDGYRMKKPDHCRREIYNIMYYCWDSDQKARPSFPELVKSLEELILSEVDYIQLDNFPDHTYYNFSSVSTSSELL